jgi:hypothetical protein
MLSHRGVTKLPSSISTRGGGGPSVGLDPGGVLHFHWNSLITAVAKTAAQAASTSMGPPTAPNPVPLVSRPDLASALIAAT